MGNKYVPIPKEETYILVKKAQGGDEEAKGILLEQNTGLVKTLALKFLSPEHELEDLMQIGYMGLWKAIEHFDSTYDVMFSTYAVPMIMGEIKRYFRDNGRIKVSRSLKGEIVRLKRAEEEFVMRHGVNPRISQLAEIMDCDRNHIAELLEAREQIQNVASLDNQLVEKEYEQCHLQGSPESRLDHVMMKGALELLGERERKVILLRYFRDMTQQQIAGCMGISQVQVSRIEKKALQKLREKMEDPA